VRTIVVASPAHPLAGRSNIDPMLLRNQTWLVGPAGGDPQTPLAQVARALRIPAESIREEPSQAGATMEIEMGRGIGPALSHVVADELRRGVLVRLDVPGTPWESFWQLSLLARGGPADTAAVLKRFITQPEATRAILSRSGGERVERFRPRFHVTIWSGE
jgi:LysR family transcriptional regulator, low CO2-responsive transcriptional regulator